MQQAKRASPPQCNLARLVRAFFCSKKAHRPISPLVVIGLTDTPNLRCHKLLPKLLLVLLNSSIKKQAGIKMKKRMKMSKKKSRRDFTKKALNVNPRNTNSTRPKRGGIRL